MRWTRVLMLGTGLLAAWSCSVVNAPDDPVEPDDDGFGGGSAACGDGVVDTALGETCDPPSSCPDCNDNDSCTSDTVQGSADTCDVVCLNTPITACAPDGCCPSGCDATTDPDCGTCGNQVVEQGETCDGNCPDPSCDDNDPCTTDTASGSASTCDLVCSNEPASCGSTADGCCAQGCTPTDDPDCVGTQYVLDAVHRGWWIQSGEHTSTNDNTITGEYQNGANSYFIWNLTGINGTVYKADLMMEIESYSSVSPFEAMSVWDVTTNPVTLEASGTGNIAVYQDLMTGTQYATYTINSTDVGNNLPIPLNSSAVADIQNALGGQFAIGMHLDDNTGWVRFSSGSEARIHRLIIEVF